MDQFLEQIQGRVSPDQFTFRELPAEVEEILFQYNQQFPQLRQFLSIQLYLNQFLNEVDNKSNNLMLPLALSTELTILEMFRVIYHEDVTKAVILAQTTGQYLPEILVKMIHERKEPQSAENQVVHA